MHVAYRCMEPWECELGINLACRSTQDLRGFGNPHLTTMSPRKFCRLLPLVFPLFLALPLVSATAATTPQIESQFDFSSDTTPGARKFYFATVPGHRYSLWRSTDLQNWAILPGHPQTATGLSMEHTFAQGEKEFFRVEPIDEQAPTVVAQYPAADGFAVGRFADLSIELADASGIDLASIRLTVGATGPLAPGAPGLTFSGNVLTYDSGDTALGAYGLVGASPHVSELSEPSHRPASTCFPYRRYHPRPRFLSEGTIPRRTARRWSLVARGGGLKSLPGTVLPRSGHKANPSWGEHAEEIGWGDGGNRRPNEMLDIAGDDEVARMTCRRVGNDSIFKIGERQGAGLSPSCQVEIRNSQEGEDTVHCGFGGSPIGLLPGQVVERG